MTPLPRRRGPKNLTIADGGCRRTMRRCEVLNTQLQPAKSIRTGVKKERREAKKEYNATAGADGAKELNATAPTSHTIADTLSVHVRHIAHLNTRQEEKQRYSGAIVKSTTNAEVRPHIWAVLNIEDLNPDKCEAIYGAARAEETGDPRENPPNSGIFRHDSHMRKHGGRRHRGSNPLCLGGRRFVQPLHQCPPPPRRLVLCKFFCSASLVFLVSLLHYVKKKLHANQRNRVHPRDLSTQTGETACRAEATSVELHQISIRRTPLSLLQTRRTSISHCFKPVWGRCGVVVRPLATHLGEAGSIPGGVAPGFPNVGIVTDNVAGRWGFLGISRSPTLSFR
ncbi:hypothetical protein PR048_013730 [Dryococelus australis]|uniref:Uncharacterized protein n=1 Tax=Dryococelus australis TaxID=614101 RepID=A0ABQ9HTU5_9NEOP|nr:hypothetical protein PR048_013730 [Dryococelus australis]